VSKSKMHTVGYKLDDDNPSLSSIVTCCFVVEHTYINIKKVSANSFVWSNYVNTLPRVLLSSKNYEWNISTLAFCFRYIFWNSELFVLFASSFVVNFTNIFNIIIKAASSQIFFVNYYGNKNKVLLLIQFEIVNSTQLLVKQISKFSAKRIMFLRSPLCAF